MNHGRWYYELRYIIVLANHRNRNGKTGSRRISPDHPVVEMNIGETMTFRRKLSTGCTLSRTHFTVLKTSGRHFKPHSGPLFTFYAILGRFNAFNETPPPRAGLRKYQNQIAYIRCSPGWIHNLEVFDDALLKKQNNQGQWVDVKANAQGCGIGVVLTELCLIDPAIFIQNEQNLATRFLNEFTVLHEDCCKLVGLDMSADPPSGGHVYFSAALRMDYPKLVIELPCRNPGIDIPLRFNIYDTIVARQNYRTEGFTAEIQACGGYERCDAYMRHWYFCRRSC